MAGCGISMLRYGHSQLWLCARRCLATPLAHPRVQLSDSRLRRLHIPVFLVREFGPTPWTFTHTSSPQLRTAVYILFCVAALALFIAAMALPNWGSVNQTSAYMATYNGPIYTGHFSLQYSMLFYKVVGSLIMDQSAHAVCSSCSILVSSGMSSSPPSYSDQQCTYGKVGFAFSVIAAVAIAAAIVARLRRRPTVSAILALSAGLLGMIAWAVLFSGLKQAVHIIGWGTAPFVAGPGFSCSIAAWVTALCVGLAGLASRTAALGTAAFRKLFIWCLRGERFASTPLSAASAGVTGQSVPVVKTQAAILALIAAFNSIICLILVTATASDGSSTSVTSPYMSISSSSSSISSSLLTAHASLAGIGFVLHIAVAILCGSVYFFSAWVSETAREPITEWYQGLLACFHVMHIITGLFVVAVFALLADIGIVMYTSYGTVAVIVYASVAGIALLVTLVIICIIRVALRFKLQGSYAVPSMHPGGACDLGAPMSEQPICGIEIPNHHLNHSMELGLLQNPGYAYELPAAGEDPGPTVSAPTDLAGGDAEQSGWSQA
eukprot:m.171218 g.171218  ORF g.171218 m.171218 type:complete len:551 (-) comp9934_c0_seq13:198-1850(-)